MTAVFVLRVVDDKSSEGAEVQLFDVRRDKPLGPQIELVREGSLPWPSAGITVRLRQRLEISAMTGERFVSGVAHPASRLPSTRPTGDRWNPYLGEVAPFIISDDGHTVVVVSGRAGGKVNT